jgi:hypothetical protein
MKWRRKCKKKTGFTHSTLEFVEQGPKVGTCALQLLPVEVRCAVPFKVHLANFHALGYNKFMKQQGIFSPAGKSCWIY